MLETASPIKFSETIEEATGQHQVLPLTFQAMMKLPQRVTTLPASTALVKDFIHQTLKNR